MKAIFVGGKLNGLEMGVEEIMNSALWNGKVTPNYSELRQKGACVPRKELDNQPLVDGYLSPMWDGEDWEKIADGYHTMLLDTLEKVNWILNYAKGSYMTKKTLIAKLQNCKDELYHNL